MHFKQASPSTQPRDFHAHGSCKPLLSSKTQLDFQGLENLRKHSIIGGRGGGLLGSPLLRMCQRLTRLFWPTPSQRTTRKHISDEDVYMCMCMCMCMCVRKHLRHAKSVRFYRVITKRQISKEFELPLPSKELKF